MRRFIAILFISSQLLANTELCQLMKLPVLVEHYREHGNLYHNHSFFTFLRLHYFNGDTRDADYDRDMQLPFKTNSGALLISNTHNITVPAEIVVLSIPEETFENQFHKFNLPLIPSADHPDIFQPPRYS